MSDSRSDKKDEKGAQAPASDANDQKLKITPSSSSSSAQTKKIGFLIEGFQGCTDTNRFPDIGAAIRLANANGGEYFDSISSFDSEHIGELLKNKNENDQKAILLNIFLLFSKEASPANIIEQLMKQPYRKLVAAGVFKELPKWLENLNPFTIDAFAGDVLNNVFQGQISKLKEYRESLKKQMGLISDEISMKRFLAHINRRSDLTTIYGLVGKNHLDMLNEIGSIVENDGIYRLMRIRASGRTIDVHLYGGMHGEMEHYELLAKHAHQRGLTVPLLPPMDKKKVNDDLIKLLMTTLLSSSSASARPQENFLGHRDQSKEDTNKSIDELAKQFDYWMKRYTGHNGTHNQELVSWLSADSGGKHVRDYKSFCDLAHKLNSAKYKYSTQPPPDAEAYKTAMEKFNLKSTSARPHHTMNIFDKSAMKNEKEEKFSSTQLAEKYDYWMKNYNDPVRTNNQALVGWLYADSGARYVKNYNQFCEVAAELAKKGYKTNPPPTEDEFRTGIAEYQKQEAQQRSRRLF